MSLSTATLEKLPDIETLRSLTKSIAMLDAIICPEWDYRYYSYNCRWGEQEEMASMRNGCGDDWFLLFDPNGAALKGFAHEYPLAADTSFPARIQEAVPAVFASFLQEPAFGMDMATFCIWRRRTDDAWNMVLPRSGRVSPEEDGSADLIDILDGNPETYRSFASDYYEVEISLTAVNAIYNHQSLTNELVASLNADLTISDITKDIVEIGYPADP